MRGARGGGAARRGGRARGERPGAGRGGRGGRGGRPGAGGGGYVVEDLVSRLYRWRDDRPLFDALD